MPKTNEYPILFQPEMIRALFFHGKTRTRRIIKRVGGWVVDHSHPAKDELRLQNGPKSKLVSLDEILSYSPYGRSGDVLWIRENYSLDVKYNTFAPTHENIDRSAVYYPATDSIFGTKGSHDFGRTRPSIHMPRWASSIDARVVKTRIARVQDMSPQDAVDEGINVYRNRQNWAVGDVTTEDPLKAFELLWDQINASFKPVRKSGELIRYESYPWADIHSTVCNQGIDRKTIGNPWVWDVEFEPVAHSCRPMINNDI